MKKLINTIAISILTIFLASCAKDEYKSYDNAFIHIMKDDLAATTVKSDASFIATYNVYLSSFLLTQNLDVNFQIIKGDGLTEGIDYQVITTGTKLVFMPYIFDMPIRIKWLPRQVDPAKNNTLTIKLVSNSMNFIMGLPGGNNIQKDFIITKIN